MALQMAVSLGGVAAGRLEWCVLTDTDISSVAYKTPCNNYREEMILYVFVSVCRCLQWSLICLIPPASHV